MKVLTNIHNLCWKLPSQTDMGIIISDLSQNYIQLFQENLRHQVKTVFVRYQGLEEWWIIRCQESQKMPIFISELKIHEWGSTV